MSEEACVKEWEGQILDANPETFQVLKVLFYTPELLYLLRLEHHQRGRNDLELTEDSVKVLVGNSRPHQGWDNLRLHSDFDLDFSKSNALKLQYLNTANPQAR